MKQQSILLILMAFLLMNFQCEQRFHKPLTIANVALADACTDDQSTFDVVLYLQSQDGFLPADEKIGAVGEMAIFQFTTFDRAFVKLSSENNGTCRSAWYAIDLGKRQSINMSYTNEQRLDLLLTSTPSDPSSALSVVIHRKLGNSTLFGDDDEQELTDLSVNSFPITDITVSTASAYRLSLYEHIEQSRSLLNTVEVETGDGEAVVEVRL